MTTQPKIDGWCAWHPEFGLAKFTAKSIGCRSIFVGPEEKAQMLECESQGWQIKPVRILDAAQADRLERIAATFDNIRQIERKGAWDTKDDNAMAEFGRLMVNWFIEYDAIMGNGLTEKE